MKTLINSENKINTIYLNYVKKLDFWTCEIYIEIQKKDDLRLKIYAMVIAMFLVIK